MEFVTCLKKEIKKKNLEMATFSLSIVKFISKSIALGQWWYK